MKQTAIRYGLYSAILLVALGMIHMMVLKSDSEVMGYLSILISMVFVFIGIRSYRDNINNGKLSFGQGLMVGLLIILIPSVAFGLLDYVYTHWINPGWMDDYYNKMVEKIKLDPDFEAKRKKFESERATFSNPFILFIAMFGSVFIVGTIVTIISSIALKKK
jgi:hypothetical protein